MMRVPKEALLIIESGRDGGGWRQFLDGKAIHAGELLDMQHGDTWMTVRYEMQYHERRGLIYLRDAHDQKRVRVVDDTMQFSWPR